MPEVREPGGIPEGWVSPSELAEMPGEKRAVLGFSGGPDSTAVFDILLRTGFEVTAVHIDHMIRDEEAERDADFCRGFAESRGARFILFREDVPAEAGQRRRGLEETAREIRYSRLSEVMDRLGIPLLVTAHNADDNAETVLFNIARGCSARGGAGIPPVRDLPGGGKLVRPALGIPKKALLGYCLENRLDFVTDSSNGDPSYSRNRIRLRVIPELTALNGRFLSAAGAFSESLREDCDYLDGLAAAFLSENPHAGPAELSALPAPVSKRVIALAARRAGAFPERRHIAAIHSALTAGRSYSVTLPGSVKATVGRDGLTFEFDGRRKKRRTGNME